MGPVAVIFVIAIVIRRCDRLADVRQALTRPSADHRHTHGPIEERSLMGRGHLLELGGSSRRPPAWSGHTRRRRTLTRSERRYSDAATL